MNNIIKMLNDEQMKQDVPAFGAGDTVVVQVRVKEGDKERLQAFEGVCTLHSQYVKSLMAKVLSVLFKRTAH